MNVLITGERGFISKHLKRALITAGFNCDTVSLRAGLHGLKSLTGYDAVIHCAALVHTKDSSPEEFHKINTELTAALAEKAKNDGVRCFIFMSTMAVYGLSGSLRGLTVIDSQTPENPTTLYGKSKLKAEKLLWEMSSEFFFIYILRLPMVYGDNAPGNYSHLYRLIRITPIFPKVSNERSMISIENLQDYILSVLQNSKSDDQSGNRARILFPQDPKPVCTTALVESIAVKLRKKLVLSAFLGKMIMMFPFETVRKLFGNLTYAQELTQAYQNFSHSESSYLEAGIRVVDDDRPYTS